MSNNTENTVDEAWDELAEDIHMLPWVHRYGYTILLVTMTILLLVAPILSNFIETEWLINLFVYATFVAGLAVVSNNTGHFKTLLALIVTTFALDVLSLSTEQNWIDVLAMLSNILLYGYLACLILNDILLKRKAVTFDMICGAICVYLLIGMFFAFTYILIQYIEPSSFAGVKFIDTTEPSRSIPGFIYFSFVTLTTLGYGDISPNTIEAGSFVYMETIIGQVYMTVLVARLVGMHIAQNSD